MSKICSISSVWETCGSIKCGVCLFNLRECSFSSEHCYSCNCPEDQLSSSYVNFLRHVYCLSFWTASFHNCRVHYTMLFPLIRAWLKYESLSHKVFSTSYR